MSNGCFDYPRLSGLESVCQEEDNMNTAEAIRTALTGLVIAVALTATAYAQWDPYPWKNMPRNADGTVNMNAPARRTVDGHPDLSGFWMPNDNVRHLLSLAS